MGYTVEEGPEIETAFYNLTRSISAGAPGARFGGHFYLSDEFALRSQTSNVQIMPCSAVSRRCVS